MLLFTNPESVDGLKWWWRWEQQNVKITKYINKSKSVWFVYSKQQRASQNRRLSSDLWGTQNILDVNSVNKRKLEIRIKILLVKESQKNPKFQNKNRFARQKHKQTHFKQLPLIVGSTAH